MVAAGLALAVVGAVLLWWGYWPRRKGHQPHCAGCDYLLLGNRSGRCPECGRELTERSIVVGTRTRRKGVAAVGLMLLLLAALFFGGAGNKRIREIDWYRYRPAAWVVGDAGSDHPALAARAWQELARRRSEGTLPASADAGLLEVAMRDVGSADRVRAERAWAELMRRKNAGGLPAVPEKRLIEIALTEQGKPRETGAPLHQQLIEDLAERYLAGRLTAAQQGQFFSQAVSLDMKVRPIVVRGDPVPYSIESKGEYPMSDSATAPTWWYATQDIGVWCDGKQVRQSSSSGSGTGFPSGSSRSQVQFDEPGKHVLEVRQRVEIYYGKYGDTDPTQSRLCSARDLSVKGPFELLAVAPPDYIKRLDRPDLLPTLRSRIKVQEFGFPSRQSGFQSQFFVDAPPVNLAFEVFARTGGKEYAIGTLDVVKGKVSGYGQGSGPEGDKLKELPAGRVVDVVLRSSETVARGTVDLFEIWQGEIVIPDVQVQRPVPATRRGTVPSVP